MSKSLTGESETKQGGRWQQTLVFAGVPIIFLTAILTARIVWEETFLTLQQGPQMIGFSLAHGSAAVLLFTPPLLALWLVIAFLTMAVTLWRRRRLSILFRCCLGAGVIVLGVLAFPSMCWQWIFINSFAKSPHAADLMVYAAGQGDVRTVCGYLNHGVSLEARNYEGSTSAFTSAAGGSVSVLELLASRGSNLNAINDYGDSPLEAAVENHNDAAVAFLKSKGAMQIKGSPEQREAASHAIVQKAIERQRHPQ